MRQICSECKQYMLTNVNETNMYECKNTCSQMLMRQICSLKIRARNVAIHDHKCLQDIVSTDSVLDKIFA